MVSRFARHVAFPAALLSLTLAVPGCVTTGKRSDGGPKPLAEKTEDKTAKPATTGTTTVTTGGATTPTTSSSTAVRAPTLDEQLAFVRTHSSPAAPFSDTDHQMVAAMPSSPTSGTVAEAALALGIVKAVLHPMNVERSTFKEADIATSGSATTQGGTGNLLSLEGQCRERGVNLADALVENPLLGSYGVARQVLQALDQGQNSQEYRTEITVALRRQAALWTDLASTMPVDGGVAATPSVDAASVATQPIDDSEPPNPADLAGGDAALAEAQALADRGDFQSAIKKAMAVGEGPLKPAATEKVREFSNLAVQDLRRKAAQAFQSAMPVTDARKRAEYLRQAKTYLEEAIKNFPDATQLPTVRDNLRVISRDLEKLDAEVSKGH